MFNLPSSNPTKDGGGDEYKTFLILGENLSAFCHDAFGFFYVLSTTILDMKKVGMSTFHSFPLLK